MKKLILALALVLLIVCVAPFAMAIKNEAGKGASEKGEPTLYDANETSNDTQEKVQTRGHAGEIKALKGDMKELRKEAKANIRTRMEELKQSKKQLADCKGKQIPDCKTLRAKSKIKSRDVLLNSVDNILGMLEETKTRITASELPEDKKTELLTEIEERIAKVQEAKRIENIRSSSPRALSASRLIAKSH